jgi:hypothetical protein
VELHRRSLLSLLTVSQNSRASLPSPPFAIHHQRNFQGKVPGKCQGVGKTLAFSGKCRKRETGTVSDRFLSPLKQRIHIYYLQVMSTQSCSQFPTRGDLLKLFVLKKNGTDACFVYGQEEREKFNWLMPTSYTSKQITMKLSSLRVMLMLKGVRIEK